MAKTKQCSRKHPPRGFAPAGFYAQLRAQQQASTTATTTATMAATDPTPPQASTTPRQSGGRAGGKTQSVLAPPAKKKRKANSGRAVGGEDPEPEMTVAEMVYIMENEDVKECIWVKTRNEAAGQIQEETVDDDSAEDEIVVKTETKAAKEPVAEEPSQEGSWEKNLITMSSSP